MEKSDQSDDNLFKPRKDLLSTHSLAPLSPEKVVIKRESQTSIMSWDKLITV